MKECILILENKINKNREKIKEIEKKEKDFLGFSEVFEEERKKLLNQIEKMEIQISEIEINKTKIDLKSFFKENGIHYLDPEEDKWKKSIISFVNSIKTLKPKKDNSSKEFSGMTEIRDGIIYSEKIENVFKINIKLEENNLLILKEKGEETKILRFCKDGWFQLLHPEINLEELEIKKIIK